MFDSVALDVVIGLIFIFLLYSLLATSIGEGVSTLLNLRGRVLFKSVERMLSDEYKDDPTLPGWRRMLDYVRNFWCALFFRARPGYRWSLTSKFYNYPSIKYLSQNILFKLPAYISAATFSGTLIEVLRFKGVAATIMEEIVIGIDNPRLCRHPETKRLLHDMAIKANGDVNAFKAALEIWFNETMDRASGVYKVNIQLIQFVVGMMLAMSINVNTLDVVKLLARDKTVREGLVKMASDPVRMEQYRQLIAQQAGDSLKADPVYYKALKELNRDASEANKLLGAGWRFRREERVCIENKSLASLLPYVKVRVAKTGRIVVHPTQAFAGDVLLLDRVSPELLDKLSWTKPTDFLKVDSLCIINDACPTAGAKSNNGLCAVIYGPASPCIWGRVTFVLGETFGTLRNFLGFLLTALAVCLGAPFWFDLLNRVVVLRAGGKNPDAKKDEAQRRSEEKKFDSSQGKVNAQGHQLAEHVLTDPVRYAMAINDHYLRSVPGVVTVNKDYKIENAKRTPCIEVTVLPTCDRSLLPASVEITFEDAKRVIPVEVRETAMPVLQNDIEFVNAKLAIRNAFLFDNKKNWGTVTGLVKLRNKKVALLSCAHVLQGDNKINELNATTDVHGGWASDAKVGTLAGQFHTLAVDVAWVAIERATEQSVGHTRIRRPRIVTDRDADVELPVIMKGGKSGEQHGTVWNTSAEAVFPTTEGFATMFDLLKLTRRHGESFTTLSQGGDSGALVVDVKGTPVAMVIGGDESYTYAVKLTSVFGRLDEIQYFESV